MNSTEMFIFCIFNKEMCKNLEHMKRYAFVEQSLYNQIVDLGARNSRGAKGIPDNHSTLFKLPSNGAEVKAIFDLLAKYGITPKFQHQVEVKEREKHFTVTTRWEPTRKQLNEAEFFQITTRLYDSSNVGKLLGMDADHLAHVAADKEQWKRQQELAEIGQRLFIASDRFRQRFEEETLVGLKLNELQWYYQAPNCGWDEVDAIDDPRGRQWVTSSVVMPPCLTPRRYADGPNVGAVVKERKPSQHHYFDSEGLAPTILRFKRSDVEKMGRFDVAITRECTHQTQEYMGPNDFPPFRDADYWLPDIIVSRRFKEWLSKSGLHGCKRVEYRLVELV
jgi:hypothetical protein